MKGVALGLMLVGEIEDDGEGVDRAGGVYDGTNAAALGLKVLDVIEDDGEGVDGQEEISVFIDSALRCSVLLEISFTKHFERSLIIEKSWVSPWVSRGKKGSSTKVEPLA